MVWSENYHISQRRGRLGGRLSHPEPDQKAPLAAGSATAVAALPLACWPFEPSRGPSGGGNCNMFQRRGRFGRRLSREAHSRACANVNACETRVYYTRPRALT